MSCSRCGAPYLPADPECPRCGLHFPTAATPHVAAPGKHTTGDSERPWLLRGASVIAVLLLAFVALNVLAPTGDDGNNSRWRPSDLPDPNAPTASAAPTGENLAKNATIVADRTGDPGVDGAGQTITYSTANLVDDDLETAWRATGYYSGEEITITLPTSTEIRTVGLTNGYTKIDATSGDDRYTSARRIRSVTWLFDGGPSVNQDLDDGEREIQYKQIDPVQTQTIRLRINQTTTPGKFNDDHTAITELFLGAQ
ncbi:hypothetical protein Kisp01_39180 [Kineosporia sp. NBRC 101677]|uniref:NADase-type glycan-binding domain-containing protein n=1 Tax=Kineosporia sp. NBRC 101677 TaxID=3032197 RepID=UPI0024A0D9FA|nr:hypothetical protein [Kineosporia sp. NBRC 101677]GLY16903.1 hypothetical protein Kisp01_39180 [Kineosporia sp. NBRC 101677]